MRSALDFSSWQTLVSTLLGLVLVSVVAVGVRLLVMQTVQQRRERENRQINERLKTLIAAYKTLGGSFTGVLAVDPRHLRELRQLPPDATAGGSERARRVRDAVEAALSDVILLGTDEQVRLAAHAATGDGRGPAGGDRGAGHLAARLHPRRAGARSDSVSRRAFRSRARCGRWAAATRRPARAAQVAARRARTAAWAAAAAAAGAGAGARPAGSARMPSTPRKTTTPIAERAARHHGPIGTTLSRSRSPVSRRNVVTVVW